MGKRFDASKRLLVDAKRRRGAAHRCRSPSFPKVAALQNTSLYIQSAYAPTVRLDSDSTDKTQNVFLSPSDDATSCYQVPIQVVYAVDDSRPGAGAGSFQTSSANLVGKFTFDNWDTFAMYDSADSGTVLVDKVAKNNRRRKLSLEKRRELSSSLLDDVNTVIHSVWHTVSELASDLQSLWMVPAMWGSHIFHCDMNTPFGAGVPTVSQLAATSSAAMGNMSPLSPSMFTQTLSKYNTGEYFQTELEDIIEALYINSDVHDMALCSQYPNDCGKEDARFLDGGFVDNNALAQNVAMYQSSDDADLTKTLKIILTANRNMDETTSVFSYFRTS